MDFMLQPFEIAINISRIANIHYFELTNRYHTKDGSHNFCELLYVDRGTLRVHAENFSGDLSVNQLIIHRPDEIHSLSTSDTVAPNVIIIGFECESSALVPFSERPVTLSPEHRNALSKIMNEGISIFEPPYDIPNTTCMKKRSDCPFGADQMLKISLESFLISLVRDFHGKKEASKSVVPVSKSKIQSVRQYLDENFTAKITLDNLCFLFGMNKTTLCQNFKHEYGSTVLNYINSLKIREAKSLLREENMSIAEISDKLGFESIHYFSRMFKKHTGHTPTEYAKSVKAKLYL